MILEKEHDVNRNSVNLEASKQGTRAGRNTQGQGTRVLATFIVNDEVVLNDINHVKPSSSSKGRLGRVPRRHKFHSSIQRAFSQALNYIV